MDGQDRGLLRQIFLLDARESLVVLESARVGHEEPGTAVGATTERLLAAAQRLKGTATFLGFSGLAQLADLATEALEGARTATVPDSLPLDPFFAAVVPALRCVLQQIAETGQEDASEVARLAATVPRLPPLDAGPPIPTTAPVAGSPERANHPAPPVPSAEMPAYFVAEAYERLDAMAASVDTLEREGPRPDALGHLLRSTHSLKGAAYTVGCTAVGDVAHALETLLVEVREDRLALTPAMIDSALAAIDTLRLLIDAAPQGADRLSGVLERAMSQLRAHLPTPRPAEAREGLAARREATPAPTGRVLEELSGPAVPQAARLGIRVDVERLDVMLNLVGELLVARGRLDAHLTDIEHVREAISQSRSRMERAVSDFGGLPPDGAVSRFERRVGLSTTERFASLDLERYDDADVLLRRVSEIRADLAESEAQLADLIRTVSDDSALVRRLTDRLRDEVVQIRLVSVGRLLPRVVRQIREVARAAGKTVAVELAGDSVEVDNAILEQVADPLLHLAQNAVTHGIEPEEERRRQGKPPHGTIRLRAELRGNAVWIQVADDGRGIDPDQVRVWAVRRGLVPEEVARRLSDAEALELVYLPGLSTAPHVTTASGRGVGMDVVRTNVTRLNGEITMETAVGVGTTFTVRLPLTLLVSEALMVRVGSETLAIPLNVVQQVLVARPEWIQATERGETLPLYVETADVVRLDRVLGLSPAAELDRIPVVVLRGGGRSVALVVGEILKKEAIVVKGLGPFLEGLWPFAGGTISADGRVILVLDPNRLLQPAAVVPAQSGFIEPVPDVSAGRTPAPVEESRRVEERRRILLVDDSISVRKHVGHMLEKAGFVVVLAVDGVEALERLGETRVDAVITDLEMPRMNGFELMQELRRRPELRELPIVVLTTRAGSKHLNLARWLGANHYVAKPVEESAFVALIESVVASSATTLVQSAAR